MFKVRLTILCTLIVTAVFAQETIKIGVLDFYFPSNREVRKAITDKRPTLLKLVNPKSSNEMRSDMLKLRSNVVESLLPDKRFTVLTRGIDWEVVNKEKELQKSADFVSGYVVEQGRQLGADYLIQGIYNIETLSMDISVLSVSDGRTVARKEVPLGQDFRINLKSDARKIGQATKELVQEQFPLKLKLFKILKNDKKACKVEVLGGSRFGIKRKQNLFVYEDKIEEVDGVELSRTVEVGRLEVIEVQGKDFAICKVLIGHKEIRQKFDAKEEIYITIRPRKTIF